MVQRRDDLTDLTSPVVSAALNVSNEGWQNGWYRRWLGKTHWVRVSTCSRWAPGIYCKAGGVGFNALASGLSQMAVTNETGGAASWVRRVGF